MNKTKKKEITENASRDLIASVGKWMISPVMGLLLNLEGGYSCSVNYFGCKPLHATTVSECPCKGVFVLAVSSFAVDNPQAPSDQAHSSAAPHPVSSSLGHLSRLYTSGSEPQVAYE
jgi:hypothetical protein